MTKLNLKLFCVSFILLPFVGSNSALDQEGLEHFDMSKVMVRFDPHVSVLDQYHKSRYGSADLIPLIQKVSTRFNKILLSTLFLDPNDNDNRQRILKESLFAAALYNCLPTTKYKVKVFLELHGLFNENHDFHFIISLADKANTECNGTVVSIIVFHQFKYSSIVSGNTNVHKFKTILNNNLNFNYSLGFSMGASEYCDFVSRFAHVKIDFLLIHYRQDVELSSSDPDIYCKSYNITKNLKNPVKLIMSPNVLDIRTDFIINMTRLITIWRLFLTMPSDIYAISTAFDSYAQYAPRSWSTGWWYLSKDPGNGNTSEYVFEEKISVASKFDFEENPKNFKWLEQNHNFDENTTGIISDHENDLWNFEFKLFCRVMSLKEWIPARTSSLIFGRKNPLKTCTNFSVYHMPIFKKNEIESFNTLEERLVHLYKNGPINISVDILGDELKTQYGYAFPLEVCGKYGNTNEDVDHIHNKINEPNVAIVLFYFYEDEPSVRLGATTVVRHRIAFFENCKRLVHSVSKTSVEMAFVSLGYSKVDTFSISPVAVQNYVKYTYFLENWAKTQTNTVVFLGRFKDEDISLNDKSTKHVVGWMSYYASLRSYVSKREEGLKLSMMHYPKPVYNITEIVTTVNITTSAEFSRSQIFFVVAIPLAVGVILIAVVAFLIRRYYKNDNITNAELSIFFHGDEQSDNCAHKIPYDKERYEILEKDFKIESEVRLGVGEFGAVYPGTIDQPTGKLQVAVKTSNSDKIHKTQITGLLSEIKVLAFIGKHANITELLGANTESLKNGKVYIFLEFCHLGSLQKYLQEMRALVCFPIQEINLDAVTNGNTYTNASASQQTTLDDALFNDLYRWSTEICNGMSFLAEKQVVHADLATRNVLLNLRREAKICDFGLSRRMYNYTNYVKAQQEPLPWKWMAPESFRDMIFNEKTDVWAYGVTRWEIYSLATNPYAGLSWDANFSEMLERGLRLSKPVYCERDMYERIQKCWNIFPDNRPTFSEILLMMQSSDEDKEAN